MIHGSYREEPNETDHDSLCPLNEDSPDYDIDGYCQCHEIKGSHERIRSRIERG